MGEDKGYSASSLVVAFILGGVMGAAVALAFAPWAGRETREKVKKLAEEAAEKVKETVQEGKDVVEEGRSIITAVYEAGREAMKKEKERLAEEAKGQAAS